MREIGGWINFMGLGKSTTKISFLSKVLMIIQILVMLTIIGRHMKDSSIQIEGMEKER